jgi:hypothetical protein
MKTLALLFALGASASAFAPQPDTRSSPVLKMSEKVASKEKVPCFGATPLLGDNRVFFGENYWDKLTMEYGSAETGQYLQAAELKRKCNNEPTLFSYQDSPLTIFSSPGL